MLLEKMQYIRTVILIFCDCELIPKHQKNNKNKEKKTLVQINKVEKQYFKMNLGLFHI